MTVRAYPYSQLRGPIPTPSYGTVCRSLSETSLTYIRRVIRWVLSLAEITLPDYCCDTIVGCDTIAGCDTIDAYVVPAKCAVVTPVVPTAMLLNSQPTPHPHYERCRVLLPCCAPIARGPSTAVYCYHIALQCILIIVLASPCILIIVLASPYF